MTTFTCSKDRGRYPIAHQIGTTLKAIQKLSDLLRMAFGSSNDQSVVERSCAAVIGGVAGCNSRFLQARCPVRSAAIEELDIRMEPCPRLAEVLSIACALLPLHAVFL